MLQIQPRRAWTTRASQSTPARMTGFTSGWFWHWNGPTVGLGVAPPADDVARFLRGVQSYHIDSKGWNDIAYSFAVDPLGRIWELRGWGVAGAHTEGHNTTSMAVFFTVGVGDPITPAMVNGAEQLMIEGLNRGYSNSLVRPHSDVRQTSCPGDGLRAYLAGRTPPRAAGGGGGAAEIQQILADLSDQYMIEAFDPGPIDGDIGPNTVAAMHAFKNHAVASIAQLDEYRRRFGPI